MPDMGNFLAVVLGGGIGAGLRYWLAGTIAAATPGSFPVAIMVVNILGSFIMGVLTEAFALRFSLAPEWRTFLTAGILGGFTTFSSFSLEAGVLIRRDEFLAAGAYMALSVGLSIGALFLGLWLARILFD